MTFFLTSVIIGGLLVFLLNSLDEQLYMSLRGKVVQVAEASFTKQQLKQWEVGLLKSRRAVEGWSGQVVGISIHYWHKSQEYAAAVSSHETVQQYLETIQSGWHIVWVWLGETYATLSVLIPEYYDSVKRLISESSKAS